MARIERQINKRLTRCHLPEFDYNARVPAGDAGKPRRPATVFQGAPQEALPRTGDGANTTLFAASG